MLNIVISLGETKRFPSEMKTIGFVSDISVTHIKEKWFLNPSPQKSAVSFPKRCGCCCSERVLRKLTFIKDFERVLCNLCNLLRILCNFAESKGFAKKKLRGTICALCNYLHTPPHIRIFSCIYIFLHLICFSIGYDYTHLLNCICFGISIHIHD